MCSPARTVDFDFLVEVVDVNGHVGRDFAVAVGLRHRALPSLVPVPNSGGEGCRRRTCVGFSSSDRGAKREISDSSSKPY